jgi:hypothetical protein
MWIVPAKCAPHACHPAEGASPDCSIALLQRDHRLDRGRDTGSKRSETLPPEMALGYNPASDHAALPTPMSHDSGHDSDSRG